MFVGKKQSKARAFGTIQILLPGVAYAESNTEAGATEYPTYRSIQIIVESLVNQWFVWGVVVGAVILSVPLLLSIRDERYRGMFKGTRGTLLAIGSFMAVSGLAAESLESSIERHEEASSAFIASVIEGLRSFDGENLIYTSDANCTAEGLLSLGRSGPKDELSERISDATIKCVYLDDYALVVDRVEKEWGAHESLYRSSGRDDESMRLAADGLIRKFSGDADHLERLRGDLVSSGESLPQLSLDLLHEKTLEILADQVRLEEERAASSQIRGIKGIIYLGVGVDVAAGLLTVFFVSLPFLGWFWKAVLDGVKAFVQKLVQVVDVSRKKLESLARSWKAANATSDVAGVGQPNERLAPAVDERTERD